MSTLPPLGRKWGSRTPPSAPPSKPPDPSLQSSSGEEFKHIHTCPICGADWMCRATACLDLIGLMCRRCRAARPDGRMSTLPPPLNVSNWPNENLLSQFWDNEHGSVIVPRNVWDEISRRLMVSAAPKEVEG